MLQGMDVRTLFAEIDLFSQSTVGHKPSLVPPKSKNSKSKRKRLLKKLKRIVSVTDVVPDCKVEAPAVPVYSAERVLVFLDADSLAASMREALPEDEIKAMEEPVPEKIGNILEFLNSDLVMGCPYKLRSRMKL